VYAAVARSGQKWSQGGLHARERPTGADERRCFCFPHQRFGGRAHTLSLFGEDGSRTEAVWVPGPFRVQVAGFCNPTWFASPSFADDGDKTTRRRESAGKPLKPLAQGWPDVPVNLWTTTVCVFLHTAAGASDPRHIPAPLFEGNVRQTRAVRAARM